MSIFAKTKKKKNKKQKQKKKTKKKNQTPGFDDYCIYREGRTGPIYIEVTCSVCCTDNHSLD